MTEKEKKTKFLSEVKKSLVDGVKNALLPEINKIQNEFKELSARMDKLEMTLSHKMDKMDVRLDNMDKRFDDINSRFDGVNSRFDDINSRFDGVNARFMEMRTDFNKRFDILYTEIHGIRGDLKSKADIVYFQKIETGYLELLKEVNELKRKAA